MMASHLWNQIHGVKCLQHGTFKIFSSHSGISRGLRRHILGLRGNPESGTRQFSHSKDLKSPVVHAARGRFVRNAPGPIKSSDAALRPSLRFRIKHGAQIVAKNARNSYHHGRVHNKYKLRDGTGIPPNENLIKLMRQEFKRDQYYARYQPCFMIPFCSKNVECFDREDFRPAKFHIKKFSHRPMSTKAATDIEDIQVTEEVVSVEKKPSSTTSIMSDKSIVSQGSIDSVLSYESVNSIDSGGSLDSVVSLDSIASIDSVASVDSVALAESGAFMPESIEHADLSDPAPQNPVLSNQTTQAASATPETSYVGYGFTELNKRKFSTFCRRSEPMPFLKTDLTQTRGLIPKCCNTGKAKCPPKRGKKPKLPSKMCKDWTVKKKKKKPRIHKHPYHEVWTKCECEPERLDCDVPTCTFVYPFPCPCDKFPEMCPIDCPPPCEHPPAPPTPLCRPPKCPIYQKIVEHCPPPCPKKRKPCVVRKQLPKMACPCKCVEPHMPCVLPPLTLEKKRAYQCTPECINEECPVEDKMVITPKKLPPIIPGDCPCIEPKIYDVPPLPRLNMQAYQKIKECKPPCKVKLDSIKCVPRRRLPVIKSDCVCIEPPPLKPVKLVRLPPICVCPEPPDLKCIPEKCPLRADEICKWKFPKKKLKNFWCPNCKIPKSKYKFCVHVKQPKTCPAKKCNRRCMCTYARVKSISPMHGLSSPSIMKPLTMLAPIQVRGFQTSSSCSASSSKARPMKPETLASLTGEKKRCPKKTRACPKLCGTVCCEPRARDSCEMDLPPLCCKAKRSPYPAFSEYGEFAELLTCECGHAMSYLQPGAPVRQFTIMQETVPKFRIIDPVLEEHCVLHDLCRPKGHTYTCETFHQGEVVPITQYECFSPHRLPCCERDQICDFEPNRTERKCDGNVKDRTYYRCECFCPKPAACPKAKQHKLDSVYSKVRKDTGKCGSRKYSTYSGLRRFSTFARTKIESFSWKKSAPCFKTTAAGLHSTAPMSKRPKPRAGGASECIVQCPFECMPRVKCGQAMRSARELQIFREMKARETKMDPAISAKLKTHFQKSLECQGGSKARRRTQLAQAVCLAKRLGLKLVTDHKAGCKAKMTCPGDGITPGPMCGPKPECKRPKNVCCPCDPRYEVDECRARKWVADCCQMPYVMSGEEFRARQPKCCKMPIPVCNRDCMRVRATCKDFEYVPCCVTESPFPAFSDCHPPFKRLIRSESQFQEFLVDESREKIAQMKGPVALGRSYSTATKAALTPINENCSIDATQNGASAFNEIQSLLKMDSPITEGVHKPMNCDCSVCVAIRKAGARIDNADMSARNVKQVLPSNALDNIPDFLFTKDDIFEQVDGENLISLAPLEMTPFEKVKCFLFNKANYVTNATIPNLPVDGFDGFISPSPKVDTSIKKSGGIGSSRSYSTCKPAEKESEDVSEAVDDEPKQEEAQVKKVEHRNVVIISKPTDLIYLLDDNESTINFSPKETKGNKVKIIPHPICTHIMLNSGELLLETEYNMMLTILPMKNRIYLPYGLSHEEYTAREQQSIKTMQEKLEKMLMKTENSRRQSVRRVVP